MFIPVHHQARATHYCIRNNDTGWLFNGWQSQSPAPLWGIVSFVEFLTRDEAELERSTIVALFPKYADALCITDIRK